MLLLILQHSKPVHPLQGTFFLKKESQEDTVEFTKASEVVG